MVVIYRVHYEPLMTFLILISWLTKQRKRKIVIKSSTESVNVLNMC